MKTPNTSIKILTSKSTWHFQDLVRSATQSTLPVIVSGFSFQELSSSIATELKGNLEADAVFVRTMPAGSLEQIVFRMDALQRLSLNGLTVVNSPKAIEASIDKYLSLAMIKNSGLCVPTTFVSQTADQALKHFNALGGDAVLKPLFGSMGNGITRISNESQASAHFRLAEEQQRVIYQQEFIPHEGFDIRVFVIGRKTWAMRRSSENWITNINQGGRGSAHSLTSVEQQTAIAAADAVGAHIAGVDLIYRKDSSIPYVLEVNAAPGWKGISDVLKIDFAELILRELVDLSR